MKFTAARLFSAVRRRLIDNPRGLGHPVPAEVFDRDYAAGRWDLLFADEEMPRNRAVADLIAGVTPTRRCSISAAAADDSHNCSHRWGSPAT